MADCKETLTSLHRPLCRGADEMHLRVQISRDPRMSTGARAASSKGHAAMMTRSDAGTEAELPA